MSNKIKRNVYADIENIRAMREKYLEKLAANYTPDKRKFYASEKNAKKDITFEADYLEKNYDEFHHKKTDMDSIKERRKNVLNNSIEKKAVETFKSFTPEEVEVKIENAQYFANNTKDFEELKKYEKRYKSGELQKKLKEEAKKELGTDLKEERMKKFFDNYEIIQVERQNQKGFGALTVGNKKTGKVEMFFFGTNSEAKTKEEKKILEKEMQGNMDTNFKVSANLKAALEYTKKIQEKSKKGLKSSDGKTYKNLDVITGHSKGGNEAIFVGSNISNVRILASDPGPVHNTGKYLNKNKILAVLANKGNATFNYGQRVPGSEFKTLHQKQGTMEGNKGSKLSSIPVLSVETGHTGLDPKDFHYNHFPDAASAKEEMKKMQKYVKKVEPKLNAYLEKRKKEKQEKIIRTIKTAARQADKITPFKMNFEKLASNIPKQLMYFRPQASAIWKNVVKEIKNHTSLNSVGKFVDSIIKPKQNLINKKNEIKLKPNINFQNKMLEFAKKTNLSLSNKLIAPIKSGTFKPKILAKKETGKSLTGNLFTKGIEIPQKNKNPLETFNKNLKNNNQEKSGQTIAGNRKNGKISSEKAQLKNQSKAVSKSLQETISRHVLQKANSSKEKTVSKNKKR